MTRFRISLLVFLMTLHQSRALAGSRICTKKENYTVTSMETYHEPAVVTVYVWCIQVPFRCPEKHTEMRTQYRVKTEVRTRDVDVCCDGYQGQAVQVDSGPALVCVPVCENCLAGACVSPGECQCEPGYRGESCSLECPAGSWGAGCMQECGCAGDVTCDPASGTCRCPSGLQGPSCSEKCPNSKWGPGCTNTCTCKNPSNECDPVTGACSDGDFSVTQVSPGYPNNETDQLPGISPTSIAERDEETGTVSETAEVDVSDNRSGSSTIPSVGSSEFSREADHAAIESTSRASDVATSSERSDSSTTGRPVIVLVSVPERRRITEKDRGKFAAQDAYPRHAENEVAHRDAGSPKTDFVKTIHKVDVPTPSPVSLDVGLIVVASIVSLGLTSVAVVMVLHMRSKLFETVRLSIYDDEKTRAREREAPSSGRVSTIVTGTLPQTSVCVNPVFGPTSEPGTILTLDTVDPLNGYANGTIGLRISGNLRDLLQEGHYDRPTATLIRLHGEFDPTAEHLYDEIPLQSTPLCGRKSA